MDVAVQVGNSLFPLVEGQSLPVQAGEMLRVFYSFKYRMPADVTVPLWASLYQGSINRVEQAQTKTTVILDKATDWQTYEGHVDIAIGSSVKGGVYGLIVELPGYKDAEALIADCIEVLAAPGITEWVGPLMMVAMMGLMTQMMPREFE